MVEKADFRVACDVGGTFTDVAVLSPDGRLALFKTPTTVGDHGLSGILTGIELASAELAPSGPVATVADERVRPRDDPTSSTPSSNARRRGPPS